MCFEKGESGLSYLVELCLIYPDNSCINSPFSLLGLMFYRSNMVYDFRLSEFIGTK